MTKPEFLSIMICVVAVLVVIICIICNIETHYCCDDFIVRLTGLQQDLKYWQEDLVENQQRYADSGLAVKTNLSTLDTQDKQNWINTIKEGQNNVSSSIKDIQDLKKEFGKWETSSILGKR